MSLDASPGRDADALRAGIAARFERLPLSRWHVTVRIVIGVVTFFEAFDQLLIAYAMPELRQEWHLTDGDATAVLTIGSLGMLIGALFSGRMADRIGRVKVIAICIGVSGLSSLALAMSPSPSPFMLLRFVQGLAIGGEVPVAATFISEITRSFKRGRFVLLYELVFPAGLTIGAVAAAWIVPALGWRWMYAMAAVPGLLCILVQRTVPESPRWLADRGRMREAEATMDLIEAKVAAATGAPLPPVAPVTTDGPASPVSTAGTASTSRTPGAHATTGADGAHATIGATATVRAAVPATPAEAAATGVKGLFTGRYRRRTLVIGALWFTGYFVNYGITSWLPTIYGKQYGLSLSDALMYSTVTSVAGFFGCLLVALTVDLIGRRKVFAFFLGGAAALLIVLGVLGARTPVQVLVWTSLAAVCFFGSNICLYLYTPELYPTRMRALGCSIGGALNRLGVILGPVLVGAIYAGGGQVSVVFMTLGGVALVGALAAAFFAEETTNRPLEEVSP
ncbi:MFS transporter [Streptomyces purpurogeneiscleroticus]|uniref:MFS transporter n=1 Tax=Streptomyces purpurogeneiscleroticus TaxID=68259 RepID=UPI001CBDBE15|nr:MFS transporter [Streptomyces purpurogeneiscleroticus]MBZ4014212.1 MFS transporter [Streptomyces purpurogeneiscleroticus]